MNSRVGGSFLYLHKKFGMKEVKANGRQRKTTETYRTKSAGRQSRQKTFKSKMNSKPAESTQLPVMVTSGCQEKNGAGYQRVGGDEAFNLE